MYPKSPSEAVGGMLYFGRMLDKIRLHARGDLDNGYDANLGRAGTADGVCCNFLRVSMKNCWSASFRARATRRFWNGVTIRDGA